MSALFDAVHSAAREIFTTDSVCADVDGAEFRVLDGEDWPLVMALRPKYPRRGEYVCGQLVKPAATASVERIVSDLDRVVDDMRRLYREKNP